MNTQIEAQERNEYYEHVSFEEVEKDNLARIEAEDKDAYLNRILGFDPDNMYGIRDTPYVKPAPQKLIKNVNRTIGPWGKYKCELEDTPGGFVVTLPNGRLIKEADCIVTAVDDPCDAFDLVISYTYRKDRRITLQVERYITGRCTWASIRLHYVKIDRKERLPRKAKKRLSAAKGPTHNRLIHRAEPMVSPEKYWEDEDESYYRM